MTNKQGMSLSDLISSKKLVRKPLKDILENADAAFDQAMREMGPEVPAMLPRKSGRPGKDELRIETEVRGVRLPKILWERIAFEAIHSELSVNRFIEIAILGKLKSVRYIGTKFENWDVDYVIGDTIKGQKEGGIQLSYETAHSTAA